MRDEVSGCSRAATESLSLVGLLTTSSKNVLTTRPIDSKQSGRKPLRIAILSPASLRGASEFQMTHLEWGVTHLSHPLRRDDVEVTL
jgi:hypothetical protein